MFNKIKPPYNINAATQKLAFKALDNIEQINNWTREIVSEREKLAISLKNIPCVIELFPSDANFLLVKVKEPHLVYDFLVGNGIIVRDRSKIILCEGCLRITVGTPEQNVELISALQKYKP